MADTFRVGLILTERCNIECAHCWLESGPQRRSSMDPEDARGYIDQALEIPTLDWVSFTGGEPFLMPETLASLVSYASGSGLRTECVTNCFWAETEAKAGEKLGTLVDAGLDVINISSDDFHQRHIPFERVKNAYEAAKKLGLKIVIMTASAASSELRIREIARRLGEKDIHIVGDGEPRTNLSALAVETGFIPVGRGGQLPEEEWLVDHGPVKGPCRDVLRDVGISPTGRVLPCCSAAGHLQQASLGNAKEERLSALIERAEENAVYRTLSTVGPFELAERTGFQKRQGYINRCHLCYEILRSA
ncbi:MAG: radical SAM protein [Candidatus Bathyarchaeota archaeon]|nr:MAG: radical SAM protein [Candidatus Bathyarchaeota archaeon]